MPTCACRYDNPSLLALLQGNITKWKKAEGDEVAAGQILAEVETDKATIDWEGQEEGFIAKLLVPDGTKDIAVGQPVAVLVDDKADVTAFKNYVPGGVWGEGSEPLSTRGTDPLCDQP